MSEFAYRQRGQGSLAGSLKIYTLVFGRIVCFWLLLWAVGCKPQLVQSDAQFFHYNEANGIASLDPALASYQAASWAGKQLFSSLVDLDSSLKVVPSVAQSWQISQDGLRWTFHLRTDVRFHNDRCFASGQGRILRASDVQFSIERVLRASTRSPGQWVFRDRLKGAAAFITQSRLSVNDHCEGIQILNDSTIVFTLQQPYAPFLQLLSMPYAWIVPQEALSYYGPDFGRHPVGTGPFVFDHWTSDVELVLKRNSEYFKVDADGHRLPYLEGIHISFIKDGKTEFLEFRSGNVDMISSLDPSIAPSVIDPSGHLRDAFHDYQLQQCCAHSIEYYGILLDTTVAEGQHSVVARNVRVRQALNYAIDRERIIRYVLNGKGRAATYGVLPPGFPGFSEHTIGYGYDPERARQLLAAAGFPAGKGLPPLVLQMGNSARTVSVAEAIQQMWKEIGVQLSIRQVDFPQHLEMVSSSKLQLWRTSWIGDYPDPENFFALFYSGFRSPIGPNTTHYTSARVDSLYTRALSPLLREEERFELYHQLEQEVVSDSPWIFLYYPIIQRLLQPSIRGLSLDGADRLVLETVRKSLAAPGGAG